MERKPDLAKEVKEDIMKLKQRAECLKDLADTFSRLVDLIDSLAQMYLGEDKEGEENEEEKEKEGGEENEEKREEKECWREKWRDHEVLEVCCSDNKCTARYLVAVNQKDMKWLERVCNEKNIRCIIDGAMITVNSRDEINEIMRAMIYVAKKSLNRS